MNNSRIVDVLNALSEAIGKEQTELYKSLVNKRPSINIEDIEGFYFGLIYPHKQFISGLIRSEISKNNDVIFIMQNSQFIEHHFRYWIEKIEGSACCADKTRTILRGLIDFYKDGTQIEFDYDAEYTFHLPEIIFKSRNDIIKFYEAIRALQYGNPNKYLIEIKEIARIISSKKIGEN